MNVRRFQDGFSVQALGNESAVMWCREADPGDRVRRYLYVRVWRLLSRFSVTS